jgi:DNA-binding transcriptional ArsR family regulator
MPETRIYAPLRRILALLHFLTERYRDEPHAVFTEQQLIEALSEAYEGGSATRTLRGDLKALRERGLVLTGQRHPEYVRLRGTKRNGLLEKSRDLKFTVDEHEALQEARRLLGNRLPGVVATTDSVRSSGRANTRVEDALLIVRLLEEAVDEVGADDLAGALGVGRQQAGRWLSEIADVFGRDLVELEMPDSDDVSYVDIEAARLRRWAAAGDSHLKGTGSDLLGLFPYSAAEARERLDLLRDFESSPFADDVDPAILSSIRWKLERWLDELALCGAT